MEPQALSLDCEALEEFRLALDVLLRNIVGKMVKKGMDSGDITGKIKIEIETKTTKEGEIVRNIRLEPKVSTSMTENGESECKKQNMALKFDHHGMPVIGTDNQISMDEIMQQKGA